MKIIKSFRIYVHDGFLDMSEQPLLVFFLVFKMLEKKGRGEETKPLGFHTLSVDSIVNPNFKRYFSVLVSEGGRIRAYLQ